MNTSAKHKMGKEKITRPADSGSAQRVMATGIAVCTEKPARAVISMLWLSQDTFLQPTLKPQPPPPCCSCQTLKITLANATCLVSCCKFTESKHKVFPNTTPEELVQAAFAAKIFFSCSVWYCSFEKPLSKSMCSCAGVADQWVFVPMLQCLSLPFHLSDKPAGFHEIVPHLHFERSQNFFRFAGKALAVGHR